MSIYVDLQEMCRWFFQFMFLFVHCLKVTALQDRMFFYGPNVKDTKRIGLRKFRVLAAHGLSFDKTENRKATEKAESFQGQHKRG
jgi:hypothetical protein